MLAGQADFELRVWFSGVIGVFLIPIVCLFACLSPSSASNDCERARCWSNLAMLILRA